MLSWDLNDEDIEVTKTRATSAMKAKASRVMEAKATKKTQATPNIKKKVIQLKRVIKHFSLGAGWNSLTQIFEGLD